MNNNIQQLKEEIEKGFLHTGDHQSLDLMPAHLQDEVPTFWIPQYHLKPLLLFLKSRIERPYVFLLDLFCIDERLRSNRELASAGDFTLVYHLLSFDRNSDIRLKVPLFGEYPSHPSITSIWPSANWYEREAWDMFGVHFDGHPDLRRILMPATWQGHPLRKEHPARATEMAPYTMLDAPSLDAEEEALRYCPEDYGLDSAGDEDFMILNVGPQHPGTHGVLRIILKLDGEKIIDAVPDIGYHHRGAEKMGERQSWHTYIPYTDRIDYLAGVMNNLAYLLPLEAMAGITIPDRVQIIRVMLCEFFRIASHLVWYGTFAQDVGAFSPVFYMFNDRERIFVIIEAICGGRMHPEWFRIGGVAQDLPKGWDGLVRDFLAYMPKRLIEYDKMVMKNRIFKRRTQGVGAYTQEEAIEWGISGPGLRASGMAWDVRKARPYSGYEQFAFDIPTATKGDCYARAEVRIEEMRQSLRIISQCLKLLGPGGAHVTGPYKATHPLTTPLIKERTMHDIESLIGHFLGVSWGPVIPVGEAMVLTEGAKGAYGYHLISEGSTMAYRVRIRSPSFPHLQMLPKICRGEMLSDLFATLGSIDYVLADVDR